LIIRLIIQTIRRDPSRSDQIDDAATVSRLDPSGAVQVDAEHRLRIWRLGFESQPGPTPASTGWDNGCNYEPGNVHWATERSNLQQTPLGYRATR
jgi:hypothetical protein